MEKDSGLGIRDRRGGGQRERGGGSWAGRGRHARREREGEGRKVGWVLLWVEGWMGG